jgi:hypothetical protein
MKYKTVRIIAAVLVAGLPFVVSPLLRAQSSGAIAQGFTGSNDKGAIVAGALVSHKTNSQAVELATTETVDQLAGVVDQSPLLSISGNSSEVQVVLGGSTNVLVSDINGPIKSGDRITASPIAGVGMKATSTTRIIGVAQADFNTQKAETQNIADSHGASHTVKIGHVITQISLANYQAPGSNFLPPFIQDIANNIAGRQVSIVRVLICTLIVIISFLSMAVFIFSSARSAMISIGRNPLAAAHIRQSLYQVGGITITAWGGALLACYLILTL